MHAYYRHFLTSVTGVAVNEWKHLNLLLLSEQSISTTPKIETD